MRKKTILAALTIVMMLFTMIPASVSAAQQQTVGEEYVEELEWAYAEYIKDRSKYCDDVWAEIQKVYLEGRQCYANLKDDDAYYDAPDYEEMLKGLGKLTWVKSNTDLPEVKKQYLKEINDEYKDLKKADYTEYGWDIIQDYLYVGKAQIDSAATFSEAAMGYSDAMFGMELASTKEDFNTAKETYIEMISVIVNLCMDPDDYSDEVWNDIQKMKKEAVAAIKAADLEYELEGIVEEYLEKLCTLAGMEYPIDYDIFEAALEELMAPAVEFYEGMTEAEYTLERIEEADEIIWTLEDDLYGIEKRADAEKIVNAAVKKLKALPDREYDESFYKNYVVKAKAAGNSGTSVKVTWNSHKDLDGYIVYRAASKNGKYEEVWYTYNSNRSYYVDKNLSYGKTYYYKVEGIKEIDWEEYYTKPSVPVKGTPKLVAPTVKLSKSGSADVLLKWNKVPGADGYQIYRSNSVNGQFKLVKTVKKGSTLQWKDTSTVKGKNYCYKIRTYDVQKNGTKKYSAYSTIKSIKR